MARAYTVGTAALALGVTTKWLDNVLSHFQLRGVHQQRQGIPRKVSVEAVLELSVALTLVTDLEIPTASALDLASILAQNAGRHRTASGINIGVDLSTIRAGLEARLAQAVEITPLPKRGRPPKLKVPSPSKTGRLD